MSNNDDWQKSSVIIPELEIEEFSWRFSVSPRSRIQRNIESVTFGGFNFTNLQFKTGFLADTDHKWGLSIYSNQINTFMSLPKRDLHHRYLVHESDLQLISQKHVKASHKLCFQRDETVAAPRMLWTSYWVNSDQSWDDTVDTIRITFRIQRESRQTVTDVIDHQIDNSSNVLFKNIKNMDFSEFFLSEYLSDIILECGGKEFPAHRIILSSRSSVFNRMFRIKMKEVEEGRVHIEAMEPSVLEELLKYVYCSEVTFTSDANCSDLFEAADRFDMEQLKILCEYEMAKKVDAESAIDMYILAELHGAKVLRQRSYEALHQNRRKIFSDRETFKMFTLQYPDTAFELLIRNIQ